MGTWLRENAGKLALVCWVWCNILEQPESNGIKKFSRNREQRLKQLGTQLLQRRQLIVASNRGPFEYRRRGGNIVPIKTSGGLVTVLNPLTRFLPFTWISSANLDQPSTVSLMDHTNRALIYEDSMDLRLRYVRTPRNVYFQHYNVFSNPFLRFLQHSIWDLTYSPDIDASIYDAWEQGYIPMNKAFANLIVQEAEKGKYPP